jgi:hypothetical protein
VHEDAHGLVLGVSGVEANIGDHICGLYAGDAQRDGILLAFLEAGLAAGDKCICVVDGTDPAEIVARLAAHVDAKGFAASKQLEVISSAAMYLRSGRFAADEVIGAWKAAISAVMYDGRFDVVRAVETWSRRDVVPDMQELLLLESEMNRYLPLYPQVLLCMYDLDRFGGSIIVSLLRTHPQVLVSGMLIRNPYYLTPDELLADEALGRGVTASSEPMEAAEWYSDVTTGLT